MDPPRLRDFRYIGILAVISSLILIIGALLRPREVSVNPAPLPSESELAQLARRAERRSLEAMTEYFDATAGEVEASIVRLPELQTSGVAWDTRLVVTGSLPRGRSETATMETATGTAAGRLAAWGPQLPLAVVETAGGRPQLTPMRRASSPIQPGDWLVAVWRTNRERAFAPGHFLQMAPATCGISRVAEVVMSLSLTREMAGGGLFDIDGNLRAVILACQDRIAAVALQSIESILQTAASVENRLLARFGLALGVLTSEEAAYFKTSSGLLVREVWTGYPGDEAGVIPGDIVSALDGVVVETLDDLRRLTMGTDKDAFELMLRRGVRDLKLALPARDFPPRQGSASASGIGMVLEPPQEGYRIDAVMPGSPAALAGVEPGDRLVRIDRAAPRNMAQVQRTLTGGLAKPFFLEVVRNGRRLGLLVQ